MKSYSEIKKELEARKDRSAWSRGVNAYALELLEELRERAAYEGRDPKPGKECREEWLDTQARALYQACNRVSCLYSSIVTE